MNFCQGVLAVWDIASTLTKTGDRRTGRRGPAKHELTKREYNTIRDIGKSRVQLAIDGPRAASRLFKLPSSKAAEIMEAKQILRGALNL